MLNLHVTAQESDATVQESDLGKSNPVVFNLEQITQDLAHLSPNLEFYEALRNWRTIFSIEYTDNGQLNPHVIARGQSDLIGVLRPIVAKISVKNLCEIMADNQNLHPKLRTLLETTLQNKTNVTENADQDTLEDEESLRFLKEPLNRLMCSMDDAANLVKKELLIGFN